MYMRYRLLYFWVNSGPISAWIFFKININSSTGVLI
jgi:hypothetical protein